MFVSTHHWRFYRASFSRDLAEGVNQLIADKELTEKMAKNGRRRVEETFDWIAIAKQVEDLYKSLI